MPCGMVRYCGCGCVGLDMCMWPSVSWYSFIRYSDEPHTGMRHVWYALRYATDAPMSPVHVACLVV
jgi:hypothetical protein